MCYTTIISMRDVINISLPPEMSKLVTKAAKSGRYASKSEFFRDLLRMWSDHQLVDVIDQSEREFLKGKGRKPDLFETFGKVWLKSTIPHNLRNVPAASSW